MTFRVFFGVLFTLLLLKQVFARPEPQFDEFPPGSDIEIQTLRRGLILNGNYFPDGTKYDVRMDKDVIEDDYDGSMDEDVKPVPVTTAAPEKTNRPVERGEKELILNVNNCPSSQAARDNRSHIVLEQGFRFRMLTMNFCIGVMFIAILNVVFIKLYYQDLKIFKGQSKRPPMTTCIVAFSVMIMNTIVVLLFLKIATLYYEIEDQ